MAYVDIATIQTTDPGDPLTAAWCDQVRENEEFLIDPPVCSVYNSTVQSVADSTNTVLTADSEQFDNDSMHSTVTNTSRVTIQTEGRYLLLTTVAFDSSATGMRQVRFQTNGTTLYSGSTLAPAPGTVNTVLTTLRSLALVAGDYVEVVVQQRSGGALDTTLHEFIARYLTR